MPRPGQFDHAFVMFYPAVAGDACSVLREADSLNVLNTVVLPVAIVLHHESGVSIATAGIEVEPAVERAGESLQVVVVSNSSPLPLLQDILVQRIPFSISFGLIE